MTARRDCSAAARVELHRVMGRHPVDLQAENEIALSRALGALAVVEAFTDDPQSREGATRALDELRDELPHAAHVHRAIVAARDCAGQAAARAAHGRGRARDR